jgi:hypothetical protein
MNSSQNTGGQWLYEKMFTSLVIREMQTKITLGFHLMLVRIYLSSRKQKSTNTGKDVGEKEPLYTVGRNVN